MNNCFHLTGTAAAVAMILSSSILLCGCGDKPKAPEKAVISFSAVGSFVSFSTNACIGDKGCIYAWKIDGESSGSERSISQVIKKAGSHSVGVQVSKDNKPLADLSANFVIDAVPESTDKALWNAPAGHIVKDAATSGTGNDETAAENKSEAPAASDNQTEEEKSAPAAPAETPAPETKAEEKAPAPAAEEKPAAPAETPAPEQKQEKQESASSSASSDGSSFTVDFGDMFSSDTVSAGESVKESAGAGSADAKTEEAKSGETKAEESPKADENKETPAEEPKAEEQKSDTAASESGAAESASADAGAKAEPAADATDSKAAEPAAPAAEAKATENAAEAAPAETAPAAGDSEKKENSAQDASADTKEESKEQPKDAAAAPEKKDDGVKAEDKPADTAVQTDDWLKW